MSRLEELIEKLCPEGIEYKTLQDVAEYRRGSFPQPYTNPQWYGGNNSMPFVQVADMHDDDFLLAEETKQRISEIAQPKSIFVEKGTILVSIQGTIGRVAITQYDCYVDRTIAIFYNIKEHNLDKKFFSYVLKQKFGIEKQYARGSTLKTITKEEFSAFTIPVPPLEVQTEIVKILDNFTELTAELTDKLTAELTARKKQYEYYRNELLTFGDDISIRELENVAQVYDSLHQTPAYAEDGFSMIRVTDVKGGYIDTSTTLKVDEQTYLEFTKKYVPQYNDIVVSRVGSYGNFSLINSTEKCCLGQNTAIIHPDILNKYLYYYLNSKHVKSFIENNVNGGSQKTLSLQNIKRIPVAIPPLEEQQRIVDVLDRFDKLCNNISEGLPAEIEARQKQYEYYRDKLLTFKEKTK